MKSLYNIAGILPAQCRSNPNDCGIAWSEHRRVERAKRDDILRIEAPPTNDALTEYSKETMAAMLRRTAKSSVSLKELGIPTETLKPIDPTTIQVGDTVRLVGSRTITEWPNCCLDVGEDYKVKAVDRESEDGLTVGFFLTKFSKPFWIYDEDLMLVESA